MTQKINNVQSHSGWGEVEYMDLVGEKRHSLTESEDIILFQFDFDRLPASAMTGRAIHTILGSLASFFGGVPVICFLVALIQIMHEEKAIIFSPGLWSWSWEVMVGIIGGILIFALFFALLIWGLNEILFRVKITIDNHEVRWSIRTIRGAKERAEPLSNYTGIRAFKSSGEDTEYGLFLQHQENSKTVLLYKAGQFTGLFDQWKKCCRALNLPSIEHLSQVEYIFRDVNDIGRPIVALIQEGSLSLPDPGDRPNDIQVDETQDQVVVYLKKKKNILKISGPELRVGLDDRWVFHKDSVYSITIHPGVPLASKAILKLTFFEHLPNGRSSKDCLLDIKLVEGIPIELLQWVQRFVLLRLALLG
ncbi:MAG: hypothetical protein AB7S77_13395 [Desulfatirhabdiaceae bacterium]